MICPGFPDPQFFFFVDSASSLLYYSHIPTAITALFLGIFVYFRGAKSLPSRLLLSIAVFFALWVLCDLITWTNNDSTIIFFAWAFFGILYSLISLLSVYFVYVFIDGHDVSMRKKALFFFLILPVLLLTPTSFNIDVFDTTVCGIPNEGVYFTNYYYAIGFLAFFWILGILFSRIRIKSVGKEEKKKWILLVFGMEFFLLSFFVSGFLASFLVSVGYANNFRLEYYGLFGMPVFMGFLTLLIVRYKIFNIKVLGAQVLIFVIATLIASQFLFVRNPVNRILTGVTLILVSFFGYFLVRSIKQEIKQKEELQMMADRLAQANQRLKKLDQAKSDFISIASHQLRTPLTSVKGFISLIMEGSYGKIHKDLREILNKVYLSNERLIHLVEDLLNISRIESGKLQFRIEPCDIRELVKDVADMFTMRSQEKNLELSVVLPKEDFPLLTTDAQKVREVLSNLIDNAVKYSEKGTIQVQVSLVGNRARISVKDEGMGINPKDLPFLFQKFSRGKDIGLVHTNGTGLGLYVGKNLIEALSGSIIVESEGIGKGSTFIIELPFSVSKDMKNQEKQVFEAV